MLCDIQHKGEKHSEDKPGNIKVKVGDVLDAERFSEDKALDLDIPEEEGRIKDKNPEDIIMQVLDLAKDYACFLLLRENPFF